jgi:hypothetical protein
MLSSLSDTVIVIVWSLMISAKGKLDELVPVPVDAAPMALEADAELEPEPEPPLEPELPAETVSPTESLASDAIVPLAGA